MIRILIALFLMAAPAGAAETMSFYVDNQQDFDVAIELYGSTAKRRWPGDGKVYLIEKGMRKSIPVDCTEGERICYGGWMVGNEQVSFGAGIDMTSACKDCCFICVDAETSTIRLIK
jgi:hypothetical protein